MKKFIVIDSIARSGTTLLSSLIRSQEGCTTLDGLFVEPFEIFKNDQWPIGYGKRDLIFDSSREINITDYRNSNLNELQRPRLNLGHNIEEWEKIIPEGSQSLQSMYGGMADSLGVDILGFRWNQNVSYAPIWLERSENNYWLVSIRNPLDRAVSNMRTHAWALQDCYDVTKKYDENLTILKKTYGPRVIIVKYEEVIENSKDVVQNIMKKMDYHIDEVEVENLIGADGQSYRNQGWRVKQKLGDHRLGQKFEGMHNNSLGQYLRYLNKNQINLFESGLRDSEIFGSYFKDCKIKT